MSLIVHGLDFFEQSKSNDLATRLSFENSVLKKGVRTFDKKFNRELTKCNELTNVQ